MHIADIVNGLFEAIGGLMIWVDVMTIYKQKVVKGVWVPGRAFFTCWGVWNLYYYPSLGQWASFTGGLVIVLGNVIWVYLAIKYWDKSKK